MQDVPLSRFLSRLIALSALPLFVLTAVLAVDHVRQGQAAQADHASADAANLALAIDRLLEARIAALQVFAQSSVVGRDDRLREFEAETSLFQHTFGGAILVADARGEPVVPGLPGPPTPSGLGSDGEAAREAVQAAVAADRPVVRFGPGSGEAAQSALIAVPLMPGPGSARALLHVTPPSTVQGWLAQHRLSGSWTVALLDREEHVVARFGAAGDDGPRFRRALGSAPASAELAIPTAEYRRPLVRTAILVALAALGAAAIAVFGGGRAVLRLATSLRSLLASPTSAGTATATATATATTPPVAAQTRPHTGIAEIEAVRQRISEADAARERAECDRADAERRAHAHIEDALIAQQVSEAQLRAIFDSASEAMLTADDGQAIVMANQAAAVMFRIPLTELLGSPLDRVIPVAVRSTHREAVRAFGELPIAARTMATGRRVTAQRADGEEFPAEAAISHVQVDGQSLYTVIVRDIGDRLRAAEALSTSRAKLDAALESMSDAVFITDNEGRFVNFNRAFATFHRFADKADCPRTLDEQAGVLEMAHLDGRPLPREQGVVPRALRGESGSRVDYRLRRRDSGETWIGSFNFAPIRDATGAIVGAVATARDVTDERDAARELQTSRDELRRLVAELDDVQERERRRIARELHDELQQPLAAIKMDASSAGIALGSSPGEARPLLANIDKLATSAIVATRRIVQDLRPRMLEDLGLVAALETLAAQHAQHTGADCEVEADDAAAEALTPAAATCLFRVAQEALNNVAKHANAASVRIALARSNGSGVRLTISDDGDGFVAGTRRPGGLGLVGMGERVRTAGGRLAVHSHPDEGTSIEVELPLATGVAV